MPISKVLQQGSPNATKALIILHGRGATAESILPLAEQLCDDQFFIVAPQAKNNAWYPNSFLAEGNEPDLSQSIKDVKDLMDQLAQKIPLQNIYIAGFSQGACLSLEISARFATTYGGIIAFTGGLIGSSLDEKKYRGNFAGTKVYISNGDEDPYIPLARSLESKALMEKLGADVTLQVYEGRPHIVTDDEIHYVKSHILCT